MSADPLVSVIIPTYNRAHLVCRTIDNVLQQSYKNFEVIVVDDGSTDETQNVLIHYEDRIRVIAQENLGPAIARNNGAQAARGEIIAFQDSDDFWHPTKLERQVALLKADPSICCCLCGVLLRHANGRPFTSFDHSLISFRHEEGKWLNVSDVLTTRFVLFVQAAAIRRRSFDAVGGFPVDLRYLEDYDLPLRLSLEGPWAFIREPLVRYGEDSPVSFSAEAKRNQVLLHECESKIYERLLGRIGDLRQYGSARRNLKRRLGMAKRKLRALRLQREGYSLARALTGFALQVDRYRLAILRRSKWFPQPITTPIEIRPS